MFSFPKKKLSAVITGMHINDVMRIGL